MPLPDPEDDEKGPVQLERAGLLLVFAFFNPRVLGAHGGTSTANTDAILMHGAAEAVAVCPVRQVASAASALSVPNPAA